MFEHCTAVAALAAKSKPRRSSRRDAATIAVAAKGKKLSWSSETLPGLLEDHSECRTAAAKSLPITGRRWRLMATRPRRRCIACLLAAEARESESRPRHLPKAGDDRI